MDNRCTFCGKKVDTLSGECYCVGSRNARNTHIDEKDNQLAELMIKALSKWGGEK